MSQHEWRGEPSLPQRPGSTLPSVINDPVDLAAVTTLIEAARAAIREHGDGDLHTVAAAVLDEEGRVHVGLNLYHFTGGPCAELVALANARTAGARAPRLIVAVGDDGRGVLAPCGRDRQVLADYYPDIRVVVPTAEGPRLLTSDDLLPHTYRWQAQQVHVCVSGPLICLQSVTGASGSPCASTTRCRSAQRCWSSSSTRRSP